MLTPVLAATYVSQEPPRNAPRAVMARPLINMWLGVVTWEEAVPAGTEWNWERQLTLDTRSLSASWCIGFIHKMQARQVTLLVGPYLQEVVYHPGCAESGDSHLLGTSHHQFSYEMCSAMFPHGLA